MKRSCVKQFLFVVYGGAWLDVLAVWRILCNFVYESWFEEYIQSPIIYEENYTLSTYSGHRSISPGYGTRV